MEKMSLQEMRKRLEQLGELKEEYSEKIYDLEVEAMNLKSEIAAKEIAVEFVPNHYYQCGSEFFKFFRFLPMDWGRSSYVGVYFCDGGTAISVRSMFSSFIQKDWIEITEENFYDHLSKTLNSITEDVK